MKTGVLLNKRDLKTKLYVKTRVILMAMVWVGRDRA